MQPCKESVLDLLGYNHERTEIAADLKDAKTKKHKLEVLVKQLYNEANTLSIDT